MRPGLPLVLLWLMLGCQTGPSDEELMELRVAPTSTVLGGRPFELTVFLSRDFQPISPPDGKPLLAVVRLPEHLVDVQVEQIWVFLGEQVWEASLERVPGTQDWVGRDGPKWGPGVVVEVVARLRERSGGRVLVRAPERPIERTD